MFEKQCRGYNACITGQGPSRLPNDARARLLPSKYVPCFDHEKPAPVHYNIKHNATMAVLYSYKTSLAVQQQTT